MISRLPAAGSTAASNLTAFMYTKLGPTSSSWMTIRLPASGLMSRNSRNICRLLPAESLTTQFSVVGPV
jgi:hypothetical protein